MIVFTQNSAQGIATAALAATKADATTSADGRTSVYPRAEVFDDKTRTTTHFEDVGFDVPVSKNDSGVDPSEASS